jgi:K+-sensing histidine kinase KdpD
MTAHRISGNATDATTLADREREQLHRQMLSSVSHDLKTPLASIIGSLEVFERMAARLTDEQRQSLIAVALQEAYRLDNFITNILDMAKLENGLVRMRHETVVISTLVEDCVTRLSHRLKEGDVRIETLDNSLQINTDATLLCRAVYLLLDNAVKYSGSPLHIEVASGREPDGRGFIRVTDNGPGIPANRMDTIFSKYTRFAKGDQQNAGTGLGLAICRAVMHLLGGSVSVINGSKGGAVFTLHIPPTQT